MIKHGNAKMIVEENSKNTWITIKRLLKYMKKNSLLIMLTVVIAIAGTVMQVFSPKLLGNATTLIFKGSVQGAEIDFNRLSFILLSVVAIYIGICVATFFQQRIMVVVSQKTAHNLRNDIRSKMNRTPVSYFDKNENGKLMSVVANDVDNIVTNLQQSLTDLISNIILVVGTLWMMISISPILTLLACVMIPGSFLIMKLFTPRTKKNNKAYFKSLGDLNGQIEETYQGFSVVKSFNGEEESLEKFKQINAEMYQTGWKAKFFGGTMMPSLMLLQNIIYVFMAIIGSTKVLSGSITIGDMQAFLQYSSQFSSPIARFSHIWSGILSAIASAERVFDMLDEKEMIEQNQGFPNQKHEEVKISFNHVQFGYTDKLLMEDFNAKVHDGQMIAIVGHTGAGKTTLTNLLMRFYEIQSGSIQIDGIDIRNFERSTLRKRIGMVLQDTWLFSGTIYDNIRYGNEHATKEQIYAAAEAAYADDFIQKLPDGYDTILNEEASNISQGQRQLITIARAFVSNPEILILDEATSNVDSRTELVIQKAMKRLLKGRTSFVVAHRLSTIYDADRILVMEQGNVVESGTHKELLLLNATYAGIYASQFSQTGT